MAIREVITVQQRQGLLINSSDTKESNNRVYYGPGPRHVVGGHTGTTGVPPVDLKLVGLLCPEFGCCQCAKGYRLSRNTWRCVIGQAVAQTRIPKLHVIDQRRGERCQRGH